AFNLLVSNPPTFPGCVSEPKKMQDWEYAGESGRLVLDAVIQQGRHYLVPGGVMYTIGTSPQGWGQTQELLDQHWGRANWEVARIIELPLADHYAPFIPYWLELQAKEGQKRIYPCGDVWLQRLYYIRAVKARE
ncbi:hypothetical protein KC573_02600, partial [candidate division WWE3 bacterium]|nr:hypothetical protein [candidate division WWE3 bacterium]